MVHAGECNTQKIIQKMRQHLHQSGGKIDYVALVNPQTLQPVMHINTEVIGLVAVKIGSIRLIDNRLIRVNARANSLRQ
jgi:pantothenate synthetase